MAIRSGDKATPFTLAAAPGEPCEVTFDGATTVLFFFPLAFSPVCSDEMCSLRDTWSQWSDLDACVYGITCDSPFVTAKFREELGIPFQILSDFNSDVSKEWDCYHEDLKGFRDVPKRSAFVIGADGTVVYDWVSDDPTQMPDFDAIREAVAGCHAA